MRRWFLPAGTMLLVGGCANEAAEENSTVHAAAAASMYHAFTDIGKEFEEETGIEVIFTFSSTGQISRQIEEGAPYDLFAAAGEDYVYDLTRSGHIDEDSFFPFAYGVIGLVFEEDVMGTPVSAETLTEDHVNRIAIANPEHAPYGKAAKEAMETWGIWDEVEDKVIYGDNIRQSYQHVETGNADVGVVSLALMEENSSLEFQEIPLTDHNPIVMALGITEQAENRSGAEAFSDFLTTGTGQQILRDHGFLFPED
ncbi:molybdate ABC transporter substrate-binding protein [Alteribacter natronophilus]|uniref:molybdate ABC transporter substrate-binding protein n=1 Tax=Alteribacter natronophilus TaxID=2583810 RepID=UPI00110DF32C|nr:molybdate ABC transporter substrate-binding protein [Alteribacter natronophilus]TMW70348.1 molybdate ABC transporter substrate-binding protein [Alteribacter natronophilus]